MINSAYDAIGGGCMAEQSKNKQASALISRVRDGDSKAFSELLEIYGPLIEGCVRHCLGRDMYSMYADDFRQEATVVFYNTALTFDVECYDIEFGLYAKICIMNALISQLRKLRKAQSNIISSDENEEDISFADPQKLSDGFVEDESLNALISVIKSCLSEFEYDVFRLSIIGKDSRQIAQKIGKDEKSVANAKYRIRKKLEELIK